MPRRRPAASAAPVPPPGQAGLALGPAGAGHDLRQSLQAAIVQAHALAVQAGQQGQAEWAGLADAMARSLQHCQQLLEGLLAGLADAPRPPAPALPSAPQWQAIDLAQLLGELQQSWQPVAAQRGLWLRVEPPAALPADARLVWGDALWLRRVLDNLVANALAHSAQGGVTVAWQAEGAAGGPVTVLTVSDTGPGLLHPAGPPPAGHGLGLLIVRHLCQALGIRVALETGPAGGTVARLTWPPPSAPG